jgi:hypothetical protein
MTEANPNDAERKRERRRQYYQANRARIAEQQRAYYQANRQKRLEVVKAYAEANQGKIREYQRRYYQANGVQVREKVRQYREENREAVSDSLRRRYAENPGKWRAFGLKRRHAIDEIAWAQMWEQQEGRCYLCRRELDLVNTRKTIVEHWHGCRAHDPDFSCTACRRGLACVACNILIGSVEDDPGLLRVIADNLERANADVAARQAVMPQHITLF